MAKATFKQEPTINLELSLAEASTIFDLLHCVGGAPERSRRKHADAVLDSLSALPLMKYWESKESSRPMRKDFTGSFTFTDNA